jgi:hypothetical protein
MLPASDPLADGPLPAEGSSLEGAPDDPQAERAETEMTIARLFARIFS